MIRRALTTVAREQISVNVAKGVAIVTIDRPEKRNALSVEMLERLVTISRQLQADDSVRVALLKGTGPCFSSGIDVGALVRVRYCNMWFG